MTGLGEFEVTLDPNVLDRIADLVCGDDTTPFYRTGYEIARFFEAAGWTWVGEVEGGRRAWVLDRLRERREDSEALSRMLLRLADPREYLDDDSAHAKVVRELNSLLALDGLEVRQSHAGPELRARQRATQRMTSDAPAHLTTHLTTIVSDPGFGVQLTHRFEEARICWEHGAPIAAVIMLGSLLEGVLYDFALSRAQGGRKPEDNLNELITLAGRNRWVAQDVVDYAHVLRNHRNLVHPRKQLTQGYAPDDDTVRIAWNVVVAALNDLATLAPSTPRGPHSQSIPASPEPGIRGQ
jgi:hypothetical protein